MIAALAAVLIFFASLTGPDAPAEESALTAAMVATSAAALEERYECEPYRIYEWFHDGAGIWIGAACGGADPEAAAGFAYSEGAWTFEIHED